MARSRRGGRTSTPMLAVWGIVMLCLGVGLGFVFSGAGCDRKDRTPTQQPPKVARKTPKAPKAEPPEPRKEAPKASEPRKEEPKAPQVEPKAPLPKFALVIDDLG